MAPPALYVVATPIGNLADMVPRAVEILKSVALIAAEDTRHSGRLLRRFAIATPLIAYHDHSDARALRRLDAAMERGQSVALIADAGTPLISDPGYRLVRHAHERGWRVAPVPGPSALLAALSVAGLPTDRFRFEGFLPARSQARRQRLARLRDEPGTMAFFEAPHRLAGCLEDLTETFGPRRRVVLARELTKTFETVIHCTLGTLRERLAADPDQCRGEIVLLLEGGAGEAECGPALDRLLGLLAEALPPGKAAAIAAEFSGLRRQALYQRLLELAPRGAARPPTRR